MNPSRINLPLNVHFSANCHVHAPDKGFSLPLFAGSWPCRVSHSRCPLIKLQPCSLLSCWQTKVLKRTPSVIASNLRHNVVFHVNWSERKGSRCSPCLLFFSPICALPLSLWGAQFNSLAALLCFLLLWCSVNILTTWKFAQNDSGA